MRRYDVAKTLLGQTQIRMAFGFWKRPSSEGGPVDLEIGLSSALRDDDDDAVPHLREEAVDRSANNPSTFGEFKIGPNNLVQLVRDRRPEALNRYNRILGLSALLKTDLKAGIDRRDEEIRRRKDTFGPNTYPCREGKSFWCLLWRACRCNHLLVITLAAVYLLLKLIDTKGVLDGWYVEAFLILATVFDIVERAVAMYSCRLEKLTEEKRNVSLDVIRGGNRVGVSIYDIVVGDIVPLKNGCQVPADGVLFVANSMKVDEQEITDLDEIVQKDLQRDPFLSSRSKVIEGIGTMLVSSQADKSACTWQRARYSSSSGGFG